MAAGSTVAGRAYRWTSGGGGATVAAMPPVRHLVATAVSSLMIGASAAIAAVAFTRIIRVGNCASGEQQFVIARECPDGTDMLIVWLAGAVILFLLGLG